MTKIEDSAGGLYQYSYDGDGQVILDTTLPSGGRTREEFSPDGKVKAVQDPRGVRTEYHYSTSDKLAEVLVDQQRLAAYRYDTQGRIVEVSYEGGADQYAYDTGGRVSQYRRVTAGNHGERVESVHFSYDPLGTLSFVSNPALGQVRFVKQPNALAVVQGNLTSTYRYDGNDGRLLGVEGPGGARSNYSYQPDGSLSKIETSLGDRSSSFEVTGETSVLYRSVAGGQTQYAFTPTGLLASVEDPYGAHTSYTYDAKNRLERIELPDERCLEYLYDPATDKLSEERSRECR